MILHSIREFLARNRPRVLAEWRDPELLHRANCITDSYAREQHDDTLRFNLLEVRPCDGTVLGALSGADLQRFFRSEEINREWHEDQIRLGSLAPEGVSDGGVNPGDRRAVYYLIRALKPRSILEVGTHIGSSTAAIALAARRLKAVRSEGRPDYVTVDIRDVNDRTKKPWLDYGAACSPRELTERIGCGDCVIFQTADSLDFLQSCTTTFDFIFLDGLHTPDRVYQEIPLALRRLRKGGFVLLHDYFPGLKPLWSEGKPSGASVIEGPFLAVKRFRDEGAKLQVIPLADLPWPTKLGSSRTSLAILTGLRTLLRPVALPDCGAPDKREGKAPAEF